MSTKTLPIKVYVSVLAALLLGLLLNIGMAFLELGRFHVVVAVAIAGCQALLVILFFMHVRYSPRLTWVFAAGGFFWLTILIVLTMGDVVSRGWFVVPGR